MNTESSSMTNKEVLNPTCSLQHKCPFLLKKKEKINQIIHSDY